MEEESSEFKPAVDLERDGYYLYIPAQDTLQEMRPVIQIKFQDSWESDPWNNVVLLKNNPHALRFWPNFTSGLLQVINCYLG